MGLEFVEFFLSVEESFGIDFLPDEEATLRTVGDVYRCICKHQGHDAPSGPVSSNDPRWRQLVSLLLALQGMKEEWIHWDTDLYRDLALGG